MEQRNHQRFLLSLRTFLTYRIFGVLCRDFVSFFTLFILTHRKKVVHGLFFYNDRKNPRLIGVVRKSHVGRYFTSLFK